MTTLINVPLTLDDKSFEQVLDQLAPLPADEKIIVDARHTRWASPYGLTALLTLAQSRPDRPGFYPPEAENTGSYWARTNFYKHAEELYDFLGKAHRSPPHLRRDVLLEITPIVQSGDVHGVVDQIQNKAQAILVGELNLDPKATMRFTMALSEACQNIIEHAGCGGWVAVQTYTWQQRLNGRRVVVIAVCDAGVGFRQSLESSPARRLRDRWNDAIALEDAVLNGVSRFPDKGRGQGFAGMRKFVGHWDGKLSVRSGTARIVASVPDWDPDETAREEGLAPFPGAQLQITIPQRVA
ncbi:MAG: ATP-binding protein [Gemmatimonadaceae bacterium]